MAQRRHHFSSALARAKEQNQTLAESSRTLQEQFQVIQDEYVALQEIHAALTIDRDNVLAQIKRSMNEGTRAVKERDVLKLVFKRAAKENRDLRGQLQPVQEEYEELQKVHAALTKERDTLLRAIVDKTSRRSKKRSKAERSREQQLKEALAKEKAERKKREVDYRDAKKLTKQLESRMAKAQGKLSKTQVRWESLRERYSELLDSNVALKRQVKKVPSQVTKLARQHERLLKDTATMHYNLGVLFSQRKQYRRAAIEFRKVVELMPTDADPHYNLGVIYAEHLPNRKQAMAHFRRYIKLKPSASDASWVKKYIATWQVWEGEERLE